jgi:tetratricopeptide (TPR) repeat protein
VYQQYLAQSDVFIGLYWQRYGQLAPGARVSGLEEEFELSAGLPRLLYVKAPAPGREPRLADLLARIEMMPRPRTVSFGLPLSWAGEWLERLEAEARNLAGAMRWYLAHDQAPLPHLFRVLWSFWFLKDHIGEARGWIGELLHAAPSLGPQARAELEWAALATANEVGDDTATLAARQRLWPLLEEVEDPFLRAVGQLAEAWTAPITGDFDTAQQVAAASLDQLRRQDEPFFTTEAYAVLGGAETAVGRYDAASRHLRDMRDLADRFGYAWLAAWSRAQLGTVAVLQGRPDQAWELLDDALTLSLAIRVSRNVALCLVGFARLALAEGDAERAAPAAGAADGLRRRAGLRAWPVLRRGEDELTDRIRQALGADRFDQVFASGARLSQREAAAAVRGRPDPGT